MALSTLRLFLLFALFVALPTSAFLLSPASSSPSRQATTVLRAGQTDTTFSRRGNKITFGAQLVIDETILSVDADELQLYVSDPVNLLGAAWPKELIQNRPNGVYRLKQEPLNFANLVQIDNFVDVRIGKSEPDGRIRMASTAIESFATFGPTAKERVEVDLDLQGWLEPVSKAGGNNARIRGQVAFTASGNLIGPLIFAPTPVLETATAVINRGVLEYARREFIRGIEGSFRRFAAAAGQPQQQR